MNKIAYFPHSMSYKFNKTSAINIKESEHSYKIKKIIKDKTYKDKC